MNEVWGDAQIWTEKHGNQKKVSNCQKTETEGSLSILARSEGFLPSTLCPAGQVCAGTSLDTRDNPTVYCFDGAKKKCVERFLIDNR